MAASGSELVTINQLKQSNANIKSSVSYMPPVGYVYISYTSTSPASIYGGQWTQLKSVFPYFTTNVQPGGASSHSHTYGAALMDYWNTSTGLFLYNGSNKSYQDKSGTVVVSARSFRKNSGLTNSSSNATFSGYGGTVPTTTSSNLPPYQGLYAWRRTS